MFEEGQARTLWNQLETLRNPIVRLPIEVTAVPFLKISASRPIGNQPDFIGVVLWAEHIEPYKTGGRFDEVRSLAKSVLHRRRGVIGDNEFTERNEHCVSSPILFGRQFWVKSDVPPQFDELTRKILAR